MLEMLTLFHPPQRRRILGTVCARAPSLPYLGTEPETNELEAEAANETQPPTIEFPSQEMRNAERGKVEEAD